MPVVAALAAAIGRIGIGEEASRLFTNKALMRSFGRKHGFPTPDFRSAATMEAARAAALAIGYPVVVKPPASQSSNGVHVVSPKASWKQHS